MHDYSRNPKSSNFCCISENGWQDNRGDDITSILDRLPDNNVPWESSSSTRCAYSSRIPPLTTQTTTTPGGAIMYQKQVSSGSGGGFHQFETGFHFDMGTSHTHRSERTSTKSNSDTRTSFSNGGSFNFNSSANSSSSSRVSSYSDDYRGMD